MKEKESKERIGLRLSKKAKIIGEKESEKAFNPTAEQKDLKKTSKRP